MKFSNHSLKFIVELNSTDRNMELLMAERANLIFHNNMIGETVIKRLISLLIDRIIFQHYIPFTYNIYYLIID